MLAYLESFSCMSYAVLSGEFALHSRFCFMWEVSLTRPAILSGEFLLHTSCCFMWEVSLARNLLFYVGSFSYTLFHRGGGGGPLHAPCCFMWGDSRTRSMLFYVGSFSYTVPADWCGGFSDITGACFYGGSLFSMPYAIWYQEFVLHTLCKFMWGGFRIVSSVFICVKNFFYTPHTGLCRTFLLQLYVPCTSLSGEFLLHTQC